MNPIQNPKILPRETHNSDNKTHFTGAKIQKYIKYILLVASFIACYYHTFFWLQYKYSYLDSYYSHGYLIPFIFAYLIYLERDKLKEIEVSNNIFGLLIIVFALLIQIISTMSDINFVSGFSMFFYILGCSLYLFGNKITKRIAFPLGFLLFMFPIPGTFINMLGLPTKSFATDIGLKIVDVMGIPHYREGFRIFLPNTMMFVGTPCNGMKSLISFLALGLLALYLTDFSIWKRLIITVFIYPLAVILNGCRIAILVFIASNYGIEKASPDSYLHDLSGLFVFSIGVIILFLIIKIWGKKKLL